jgi:uncharacterized protein YdeI (YjbR/CyaY-like superfamily)
MSSPNLSNSFYAKDRKAWRKWLEKYGEKQSSVWLLIYHKKSTTPSVYYDEAVEEALCFGWIDSKPNKRDEESFYLFFAQRKPKSNWSKINKERVERLIAEGKMKLQGMAMIELAKNSGTWTALEKVDALELPPELTTLFAKHKTAKKNFQAFPPSTKKGILDWIYQAKTDETKMKRIEQTVSLAEKNIRANQYTPK